MTGAAGVPTRPARPSSRRSPSRRRPRRRGSARRGPASGLGSGLAFGLAFGLALSLAWGASGSLHAQEALLPPDAGLSGASPHVAAGADGTVVAAFAVDDTVWCTVSRDGGAAFAAPVEVGRHARLERGIARGPRVAVTPDAVAVVAVCGETLRGKDGDLLCWRSTDRGAGWDGPVRVNDVAGAAREGLHALAAAPDGALLCVWLDLRNQVEGRGGTELWGAWSTDGGATWGADRSLYVSPEGSICECCAPSAAFDPTTGDAIVMWRNKLAGNRDMYALRIARGDAAQPGEAVPLDTSHWELEACPMAGGGVTAASDGRVLTFWRRGQGLYLATPGLGEVDAVGTGREALAVAGPDGFHLVWTDAEGRVMTAVDARAGDERSARVLGRGGNLSAGGAPDGHGPVVAVWESGEDGPAGLRVARLADRRDPEEP